MLLLEGTSKEREAKLKEYIQFCKDYLEDYFRAIQFNRKNDWDDLKNSKILSTTSINWFIKALVESLGKTGLQDFDYYKNSFSKLSIEFSKERFPYTSSQYAKFSRETILPQVFGINSEP